MVERYRPDVELPHATPGRPASAHRPGVGGGGRTPRPGDRTRENPVPCSATTGPPWPRLGRRAANRASRSIRTTVRTTT